MFLVKDIALLVPNFEVVMLALSVIDVILILIATATAWANYEDFKQKWLKTSRTKFTCMNCDAQWYANTDNDEFLK